MMLSYYGFLHSRLMNITSETGQIGAGFVKWLTAAQIGQGNFSVDIRSLYITVYVSYCTR